MKEMKFCTLIFLNFLLFTSCISKDDTIERLKSNEILVISLDISHDIDIKQITLTSTGGIDKVSANQISNKRKVKLKTPLSGEGIYSVCVFTTTDTICSQENYVEGGYRPKLKLNKRKFEIVEWY